MKSKSILTLALLVAAPATAQTAPPAPPAPMADGSDKIAGLFDKAPADKGQIIFYRPGGAGALIGCLVREGDGADEKHLSKLTGNRYFIHLATPGVHKYWVKSEATDRLTMEVEPGETYFVKCTIAMGIIVGRPNLSPSDLAEFQKKGKKVKPMAPADAVEDKKN
ncbi:MAG: hypothetical protein K2W81_06410 [Sphingomonas sp.]|uniref:hypothetical protein n=1 Tax=Sphingomonas sp. TaxID=28214 RepID=UPI0025E6EC8E|nr:hypothetical protein [Sphingomonas sp.]MBY0283580.1 hypothetical protein [Sphingomonas sp.]